MLRNSSTYRFIIALILGFSSGLPLLAIGSTLQARMKDGGIDLTTIGALSIVGIPYSLKFLWAPLFDRYIPPLLGRRRGWALMTQVGLVGLLLAMSVVEPAENLTLVVALAFLVAFASASQDIVLDAHRRDIFPDDELAFASSVFVVGYRLGTLVSGAVALALADRLPWSSVYEILAGFMLVGVIGCLLAPEPPLEEGRPRTLRDAVVLPLVDFFKRDSQNRKAGAFMILTFILLYKLGDTLAANLTVPYFQELGYTKAEIGTIGKTVGLLVLLIGGMIGGAIAGTIGLNRALWIFGFLQAVSNVAFAWLWILPVEWTNLAWVVSVEYFTAGMGTAAFVAFMGLQTNKRFSAAQYALLTSLMGVPRTLLASPTGFVAEAIGWPGFFCLCTALALPGMVMLLWVAPWNERLPAG